MEFKIFGSKSLINAVFIAETEELFRLGIDTNQRWVGFQVGATNHSLRYQNEIWKIDEESFAKKDFRKKYKQIDLWADDYFDHLNDDPEKEESATLIIMLNDDELEKMRFNGYCSQNKDQIEILWLKKFTELKGVDISE